MYALQKSPPEKVSPGKRQSSISSDIPRVPFDVDLMYWGERPKPREVAVDAERLRFWGGSGREEETIIVPGSDSSERVIEFTGSHRSGRLVGIVYFNGESLFRQISAS